MPINKFGSRSSKYSKLKSSVNEIQKQLTALKYLHFSIGRETFDVGGRRLSNVGHPQDPTDAINKYAMDAMGTQFTNYKNWHGKTVDFADKRLTKIGEPKDQQDAVSLHYINARCLQVKDLNDDNFDALKKRISNVKEPVNDTDAVTLGYLNKALKKK